MSSKIKAVVLAAGEGKRMQPISRIMPKEIVPILGKPFLAYVLLELRAAGLTDIVVVTSPKKDSLIRESLGNGHEFEVRLSYIIQREQLGPAHALLQTRSLIDTSYFLVHYGDSLADQNIPKELIAALSSGMNPDCVLALREVDDPTRYGIVRFTDKRIVEIVEKPALGSEPSRLAAMGIYILNTNKFFQAVENATFQYGSELFPAEYLLHEGGKAIGWTFSGNRVDMGTPEDLFKASSLLAHRKIRCIAFDADNTLYATKSDAELADLAAMSILSKRTNKTKDELYNEFLEVVRNVRDTPNPTVRHRKHSYALLSRSYGINSINEMYEEFSKVLISRLKLIDGIIEVLEHNKSKDMFVVTEDNREMVERKLRALKIEGYFLGIITSDETGVMKPSEKYYQPLLKNYSPMETLVVGDNYEKDLLLPAKMGMHVLLASQNKDFVPLLSLP